jgi:hypothetical protein
LVLTADLQVDVEDAKLRARSARHPWIGCRRPGRAIENIRNELDIAIALTGVRCIDEIDRRVLLN